MELFKYNTYVELNNQMIELCDSIYNYYLVVAEQEEFSLIQDSEYTYGYGTHYSDEDVLADALELSKMEPSFGEADQLVQNLYESTNALMETFDTICSSGYGAGPSYSDNQYANAKEWHNVIYTNVPVYESLCYDYFDAITALANQRAEEDRAQMLEEGRLIIYNASTAIELGRQILREVYSQEVTDANLTDLDLTNIKELYQQLQDTIADFDAAAADNDQMIKESLSNSRPFDGLFDRLSDSVDRMIQMVESGRGIDDPGSASLGSVLFIEECLSDCIDRYNSVFVGS